MNISWKKVGYSIIVVIVFCITRRQSLHQLPIINDEPLYVEYMQAISNSFEENKWISVHNSHQDWKPPLQYRLGSLTIHTTPNPVISARVSSAIIGLIGLIGIMVLGFYISSKTEIGILAGIIYTLHPTSISNSSLVMAEGLVSVLFLYTLILLFYFSWVTLQKRNNLLYVLYGILYSILSYGLFMTKQTGDLLVISGIVISPIIFFNQYYQYYQSFSWPVIIKRYSIIALTLLMSSLLAYLAYKYSFPTSIYAGKHLFSALYGYTFSISELIRLPLGSWYHNSILSIGYIWFSYKEALLVTIVAVLSIFYNRKKAITKESIHLITFILIIIAITVPFILLIKNFEAQGQKVVQYSTEIRTIIITLSTYTLYSFAYNHRQRAILIVSIILLFYGRWGNFRVSTFGNYSYDYSYAYKTRQCLREHNCNWGSQIDMDAMITTLQTLNKQGSGCVFTDPQRGHPGTLVKVLQPLYPHLVRQQDIPNNNHDRGSLGSCDRNIIIFDSKRNDRGTGFVDQRGTKLLDSQYCKHRLNWTKNNSLVSQLSLCIYSPQ